MIARIWYDYWASQAWLVMVNIFGTVVGFASFFQSRPRLIMSPSVSIMISLPGSSSWPPPCSAPTTCSAATSSAMAMMGRGRWQQPTRQWHNTAGSGEALLKQGLRRTRKLWQCTNWKVNLRIWKLAKASNRENWSVQLVRPAGSSSWYVQLVRPAGPSSWSVQLIRWAYPCSWSI